MADESERRRRRPRLVWRLHATKDIHARQAVAGDGSSRRVDGDAGATGLRWPQTEQDRGVCVEECVVLRFHGGRRGRDEIR